MNILESQTTRQVSVDNKTQFFVCEASTIGLPPGRWPMEIKMTMTDGTKNVRFGWARQIVNEGGLVAVIYTSNIGYELHVLND